MCSTNKKSFTVLILVSVLLMNSFIIAYANYDEEVITIEMAVEMARENNASSKYTELNLRRLSNNIGNILVALNSNILLIQNAIELENSRLQLIQQLDNNNLNSDERQNIKAQLSDIDMKVNMFAGMDAQSNQLLDNLEQARISQQLVRDNEEIENYRFDYNTKMQFVNLLILERNIEKVNNSLELTRTVLDIERLKKNIGLISSINLEDTFLRFNQLQSQVEQLNSQKTVAFNNFKVILGLSENDNIKLEPMEFSGVMWVNLNNGLNSALNGISIRAAHRDVARRRDYLSNVIDRHPLGSNKDQNPQIDLREAEYRLEDLKTNTELAVIAAYNELKQKEKSLRISEKSYRRAKEVFSIEELKYNLGIISKVQLENYKFDYISQEIDFTISKFEYIKAHKAYEYIIKGVLVGR